MEIQIHPHALERAIERGTSEAEIRDVLANGQEVPAKQARRAKAKTYDFRQERNGKYYDQKRVEVIFTIEDKAMITITVYVFYGKWE